MAYIEMWTECSGGLMQHGKESMQRTLQSADSEGKFENGSFGKSRIVRVIYADMPLESQPSGENFEGETVYTWGLPNKATRKAISFQEYMNFQKPEKLAIRVIINEEFGPPGSWYLS